MLACVRACVFVGKWSVSGVFWIWVRSELRCLAPVCAYEFGCDLDASLLLRWYLSFQFTI